MDFSEQWIALTTETQISTRGQANHARKKEAKIEKGVIIREITFTQLKNTHFQTSKPI